MTDQQKIKDLLAALQAQTEATVLTTAAQRAALDAFYKLWTKSVYHHHDSEENILFPYLSMKDVIVAPKVAADHKTLHTAMDACAVMVDKLTAVGTTNSPEEEAQILRDLLVSYLFSFFDERRWRQGTFSAPKAVNDVCCVGDALNMMLHKLHLTPVR